MTDEAPAYRDENHVERIGEPPRLTVAGQAYITLSDDRLTELRADAQYNATSLLGQDARNKQREADIVAALTELSARRAAEDATKAGNPMRYFSQNVDSWGPAEWFDRLAGAIRDQDKAVLAKNDVGFEICRMVAASSAMRLVRDFEPQVRAALLSARSSGDAS